MTNGGGGPHEAPKATSPKAKAPAKPRKQAPKSAKAGK